MTALTSVCALDKMRGFFAGLALLQILLQTELSSAQTGVEKCDLVAEKEFEWVTSLGGYDNLCTADDAFSLCDVTVELGDCSEDPLCLKVSEQTIPECPTACCIILWNSGAGDEPTRNGMCLHKCSVSPGGPFPLRPWELADQTPPGQGPCNGPCNTTIAPDGTVVANGTTTAGPAAAPGEAPAAANATAPGEAGAAGSSSTDRGVDAGAVQDDASSTGPRELKSYAWGSCIAALAVLLATLQ